MFKFPPERPKPVRIELSESSVQSSVYLDDEVKLAYVAKHARVYESSSKVQFFVLDGGKQPS